MEGAAHTILSNAGKLVAGEFRLLRSVGGEVAELRDELATMNALLRMQAEAGDGAVDHFIREWMKQLRELAYDAEDCVHLYILRIKCGPKLGVYIWCKRQLERLLPRHRLAGKIRALRARAVAISERHARYGLVGIRDQALDLANKVKAVKDKERDMKLKVFSIVGFGGLGKTTLAMEVCRQLETDFDCQAIVSVSQAFDAGKDLQVLLRRVLQQVAKVKSQNDKGINEEVNDSLGPIDTMDVDQLATKLMEFLDDKRYLIVVDDVWTISAWDAIQSKLPSSRHGSRIIVTTRIDSVAKECSDPTIGTYAIKELTLIDSTKLFKSKAFGSVEASCPRELETIMNKILRKYGGLPLAIISIGSLFASYRSPESKAMWETISKSIGTHMESSPTLEGMRKIITLSYNHLPYHLKACMIEVGELGQLRQIGIWFFRQIEEVLQELGCSLSNTYSLRSLAIGCFARGALNFLLEMKSPPRLLRSLNIDGDINELPSWFGSLAYLTVIHMMNTSLVDDQVFGVLSNAPNLQKIWMGPRAYVGHELVARSSHNFPALIMLHYNCGGMYPAEIRFETGSMDKLERLIVEFGPSERILNGIEHLPNLEEADLDGGRSSSSLSNALDQLMVASKKRPKHKQFKVVARYQ
ncbi:unnamed protein product [Alopecurus aequalis]